MTALDPVQTIVDGLVGGQAIDGAAERGRTLAMVVMRHGQVVAEGYGERPDTPFGPGGPVHAETPLISWSVAKSMVHAAVGIAVADGVLDLDAPAEVPAWRGTAKAAITLQQLLEMRSGLHFVEDYVDDQASDCLAMLFGDGRDDHATYAASRPLAHPPGTVWNYSSGTTNIVTRILGDAVGGGRQGMESWLHQRLFTPLGMTTARPDFDASGTWVGSSYVHASARDFARFGECYRSDGMVGDQHLLPEGWVDHARRPGSVDPDGALRYGAHWWLWPRFSDALVAQGYDGQLILVLPSRAATVVHLGQWPAATRDTLLDEMARLIEALPRSGASSDRTPTDG